MTAETKQENSNVAAVVFAAFAVVLIVAFLSYRGSDIGQLSQLVGNLGGGPLFGSDLITIYASLGQVVVMWASWMAVGSLFVRWLDIDRSNDSRILGGALRVAVGASFWSVVWFFLGLLGWYSRGVAIGLGVVSIILCIVVTITRKEKAPKIEDGNSKSGPLEAFLKAFIWFPALLGFIASLAPPIAKDTLLYHFAVPKAFIAQGGNAFVDGNIASYLAMGAEIHYVWAMLLGLYGGPRGAEMAAGATGFIFFLLLLAAVSGWARELEISRRWSLIATAIVATVPSAYHVASSGYIDIALALFVTLAAYSLTRWWKEQTKRWIVLIAIFLGAALSIKLTTVFVIAAFALIILLRARNAENTVKVVLGGFAALLLAGVIASPWYLRTWVATGSPIFPFYMSIWPGKAEGWDVERSNLFQGMNSQYGGADKGALNYLTAPVRVSVTAQPEQAENFDGVLGVAFLIGLPLLILALWKFDLAVEVKIAAGVAAIMFLFWLFSSQQLRYLLPMLPLLTIAIVASAETITKERRSLSRVLQFSLLAASVCGVLTSIAWFLQKAPLRVVLGGETRDEYLARNLDYYPYYQTINNDTPPDAKVWLINMRRDTYHIERPIVSDYLFEDWTLRKMLWESRGVQELKAKTAAMGVQYVLTRYDFLFDYERSTLVDDKRPRAENEAKLRIAREFILDPANTIKADSKFSLIKVFTEK